MHVSYLLSLFGSHSALLPRYNDAMATIRRVSTAEHNFQLVITRVYEDGDQELLEDEDESRRHCCFKIQNHRSMLQLTRKEVF